MLQMSCLLLQDHPLCNNYLLSSEYGLSNCKGVMKRNGVCLRVDGRTGDKQKIINEYQNKSLREN